VNKAFGCFHGKGLLSSFDLAGLIRFYLIPTPILAKTSRRASAAAATIQTMLYKGFSNKRAGIIKQYNTSLLRTAIFMSCNSSLLQ
jgi:preprotein translocase subunit Sec61beta